MTEKIPNLVTTEWLDNHLKDPDLRILDGSWHMPTENRDARAEFEAEHIPGAQFFDIDEISDSQSQLPHMVPELAKFTSRARALGVADGAKVVVYDSLGVFSAPRIWWMFRYFGFKNVAVLNGGLPKWKAEERPLSASRRAPRDRHLSLARKPELLCTVSEMAEASKMRSAVILDARAPARFKGEVEEPRAGLRSGHIPNSKNLFFKELLNEDGTFKSPEELRDIFEAKGVDENTQVLTSCGSGITAAILALGLTLAGFDRYALYDGSWAEWGSMPLLQVETGDERV